MIDKIKRLMESLAELKGVAEKLQANIMALSAIERERRREIREWEMLGWGYKPRLHDLKKAVAHKPAINWHRIRANPKLR